MKQKFVLLTSIMKVNICFLISLRLIFVCNAQTWSTWTSSCVNPQTCPTKSELICDNGRGIQCEQYGISPYQITLSPGCNANCNGHDNSQWEGSFVSALIKCVRTKFILHTIFLYVIMNKINILKV